MTPIQRPAEAIRMNAVDEEGGPLLSDPFGPEAQRSFDTTCRKLHRFLTS
jgi:hypothetical protein